MINNKFDLVIDRIKTGVQIAKNAIVPAQSQMAAPPKEMTFVKLVGRWYADVENWEGRISALEMVCRADDMLETLSKGLPYVRMKIATEEEEGSIKLTHTKDGTYKVENMPNGPKTIWLCGVAQFVFGGDYPDHIYFKQVFFEPK